MKAAQKIFKPGLMMVVLFCSLSLNNSNAAAIDSVVLHNIIGNNQVNAQLETEKFVWVATNDGLFLINKKQLTYRVFDPENSLIPSYHITALCSTSNGQVLIGTDNGLVRYDNFTFILLNTENTNLPSNNIVKIDAAQNGAFIFNAVEETTTECTKDYCIQKTLLHQKPFFLALGN